jgi:hypothetical protein
MGRTACTEPQCLYKGALYPFTSSHNKMASITAVGVSLSSQCVGSDTRSEQSGTSSSDPQSSSTRLALPLAVRSCRHDGALLYRIIFRYPDLDR